MFGLGSLGRWLAHSDPAAASVAGMDLLGSDVAELAQIARSVSAEYGVSSPAVISANLARLLGRRVPIRSLTSGGAAGMAYLHFSDATVLLVRGQRVGDLGLMAVRAMQHLVRLEGFSCTASGVVLNLDCGNRTLTVTAVGLTLGG